MGGNILIIVDTSIASGSSKTIGIASGFGVYLTGSVGWAFSLMSCFLVSNEYNLGKTWGLKLSEILLLWGACSWGCS